MAEKAETFIQLGTDCPELQPNEKDIILETNRCAFISTTAHEPPACTCLAMAVYT